MSEQDNTAYSDYYFEHPEEFEDAPQLAICGTMQLRMIQEGRLAHEESERRATTRRKRWEEYHLAKATTLGFRIELKQLDWSLSRLVYELRAQQRST